MSNQIYDEEFYNPDQKNRYLKRLTGTTKSAYGRILRRASNIEMQLGKDLYDFNLFEIGQLMKLLAPTTLLSSRNQLSNIRKYIDWAISNDLRTDNINPLLVTLTDEFAESFVDHTNKYLFTIGEINGLMGRLVNFQDSALVLSIFEGIMGREYSELLSLLKSDVKENVLQLVLKNKLASDDFEKRTITISKKLNNLLIEASKETKYIKGNGVVDHHLNMANLIDSEYVFRAINANTKYYGMAPSNLVSRRIKSIAQLFGYRYLTPINIRKSGMVYYAYQLYQQSKKLEREEIVTVCEHYNLQHKITTRLTKEFLNIETIESLYGD